MDSNSEIIINDKHVLKFLNKLPKKDQFLIYEMFSTIETFGIEQLLRSQDIKKIKGRKIDLYELRVRTGLEYRFLGQIENRTFIIVHAFIKKTQRAIKNEIETAIKRIKQIN